MRRITVLGGTGFLGSRAVAALRRLPDVEVRVGARRSDPPIDVTRPETWGALEGSALVIDLTDATTRAPDDLVAWCLERRITVLEATSDSVCVERLAARFAATPGRLVLGAGIFTGLSNQLARSVASEAPRRLTLGISSSPFSGAGAGTIELMLAALRTPAARVTGGARVEEPLSRGPSLTFSSGLRPTLRIPFAETSMLHASTGAPEIDVVFAPVPAALVTAFLLMPPWRSRSSAGQTLLRWYFTALRRVLLAGVASRVELVARSDTAERRLVARDGMGAAAWAIAAQAEAVLASAGDGVAYIDQVASLDPIVARLNALAGETSVEVS